MNLNTHIAPVGLDPAQLLRLGEVQTTFAETEQLSGHYHRTRALMFRTQRRYLDEVGAAALEAHATATLAIKDASKLPFSLAAQVLTNVYPSQGADRKERVARHNRVAPVAKMMAALDKLREQHAHLNDDDFVDWYKEMGREAGVIREGRDPAAKRPGQKAEATPEAIDAQLAEIIANPEARDVDALPGLVAGGYAVYVARGEGEKSRLVRMNVSDAFIASLSVNAPDPLTGAGADLLFWRQLMMVGQAIIPDGVSDEAAIEIAADDEINETTPRKSSLAMFLTGAGKFSIAAARDPDSMVVEVTPAAGVIGGIDLQSRRFINNRTRRTIAERLIAPKVCAGYISSDPEKPAITTITEGSKTSVKFKHSANNNSGQLIAVPLSDLRTTTTLRVEGFVNRAKSVMASEAVAEMTGKDGILGIIAKSRKPLPVTVSFNGDGVALAIGAADQKRYAAELSGAEAQVRVSRDDILRAINGLVGAGLVGELTWMVDPRGLLAIEGSTAEATFRVYVQTLRKDSDVRERQLLARVDATTA